MRQMTLGLLLALAIVTAASADPMVEAVRPLRGKQFEIGFLGQMAHHHESAVRMAELALEHSASGDVKGMARTMREDQTREIAKLSGWLQSWHGRAIQSVPEPAESRAKAQEEMTALKSLHGTEFDRQFLERMTKHHQSGIAMARLVDDRSDRRPLEDFAQTMISKQTLESQKMQRLLTSR